MSIDPQNEPLRLARRGEAILLAGLLVLCGIAFAETFRFKVVPWDPLGMAFWPRLLIGGLAAFICLRFWHLRHEVGEEQPGFSRGIGVLAICIAYVMAFGAFGIFVATPAFFVVFAVFRNSGSRLRDVLVALAASMLIVLTVWLLFEYALGLRVITTPFWMR